MSQQNSTKKGLITLVLALFASLVSSFCCLAPLLYLTFGVSVAGLTGMSKLSWLQYPMIITSISLIIVGFYRLYLSPKLICENIISRKMLVWLYWLSVPLSFAMMGYPIVLSWLLE